MLPSQVIIAGTNLDLALTCFEASVNQPGTIFSTEHWLQPKLGELRTLLSNPVTDDQAAALLDVLYQRHWMADRPLGGFLRVPRGAPARAELKRVAQGERKVFHGR